MKEKIFMKGYKAFGKGMVCYGKQYAENTVFEEEEAVICEKGMHFCVNPMDCMNYYPISNDIEFAEVEALAECVCEIDAKDSKYCTTKLRIGKKLSLVEFISVCVEYNKSNEGNYSKLASSGTLSSLASSGNDSHLISGGDCSKLASSGDRSKLASSGTLSSSASSGNDSHLISGGDRSKLASSGDYSHLTSGGDRSKLASSGACSHLISSGAYSILASSGAYSILASSGAYSILSSSGHASKLTSSGECSVIMNAGVYGYARGVKGTWITLAEYNDEGKCLCVKSAEIDGDILKENTWYTLENGEFVEAT